MIHFLQLPPLVGSYFCLSMQGSNCAGKKDQIINGGIIKWTCSFVQEADKYSLNVDIKES